MGDDEETASQQAGRKPKYPCLRCRKAVTKNSKSVKCGTCQLWVHTECEKMSDEMYNLLAQQRAIMWFCDSCLASAAKIEQTVKTYVEQIKEVEKRVAGIEQTVKGIDRRTEKVEEQLKGRDDKLDKKIDKNSEDLCEEMSERELRKNNAILYKVPELEGENVSGRDKYDWDKKTCLNIFKALNLRFDEDDIKFCKRLGDKGISRPLILGFFSESDRNKFLRKSKDLDKTFFKEVNAAPDLTKRQREREQRLKREAEKRNEELSEDDKSKNLVWAVVGAKGERRLVKITARDQSNRSQWGRSQRAQEPDRRQPRPRRTRDNRGSEMEEDLTDHEMSQDNNKKRKNRSESTSEEEQRPPGKK